MFCEKCGNQIPEEAKFACPHCNTLLEQHANAMNIKSHLAIAIIATLLCCVPLGIVSIVYAAKVSQLVSLGKIAEAQEASKKAQMWAWIAVGAGLVFTILYVILQIALAC